MKKLLTGNEAIARGAYESGVTVAAAYPGTPSTEILENLEKHKEVYCEWSPNEKVALEVGIGASLGGARVLTTMKHVGVNVAADPLMTFAYTGVNGGLVLVTADDPGMHSSQNEQDNRIYAKFAQIPVLEPSDSQEAKDMLKVAYDISEQFDTPVLFRITTRIAHSQCLVELEDRKETPLKPYDRNLAKYVMVPANARKRHPIVEERREKLIEFNEKSYLNRIEKGNSNIGIITSGVAYQYVKEVMPEASILKLGMTYPLPKNLITDFINSVGTCYVVEELEPFLEEQIKSWGLKVIGKDIIPRVGELSLEKVAKAFGIEGFSAEVNHEELVPVRPPVLCPGCPHRGVFYVLNKMKLNVSGDIGCYALGAAPPLSSMDTCICMGASISAAHGMEKARGPEFAEKLVAVIGDSTFYHSGMTGLVDVVYNGGTTTTLILDNSTTAMTGHQENPGTGEVLGDRSGNKIIIENIVKAIGVDRISIVDPYDVKAVEKVLKAELAVREPSVIIFRRPCVLLKGHAPQGKVVINEDKCKECGACAKIGCPSIVFKGKKPSINPNLCNGCGVCINVCPFNAIEEVNCHE